MAIFWLLILLMYWALLPLTYLYLYFITLPPSIREILVATARIDLFKSSHAIQNLFDPTARTSIPLTSAGLGR